MPSSVITKRTPMLISGRFCRSGKRPRINTSFSSFLSNRTGACLARRSCSASADRRISTRRSARSICSPNTARRSSALYLTGQRNRRDATLPRGSLTQPGSDQAAAKVRGAQVQMSLLWSLSGVERTRRGHRKLVVPDPERPFKATLLCGAACVSTLDVDENASDNRVAHFGRNPFADDDGCDDDQENERHLGPGESGNR